MCDELLTTGADCNDTNCTGTYMVEPDALGMVRCSVCNKGHEVIHGHVGRRVTLCCRTPGLGHPLADMAQRNRVTDYPKDVTCRQCIWMQLQEASLPAVDWRPAVVIAEDHYAF